MYIPAITAVSMALTRMIMFAAASLKAAMRRPRPWTAAGPYDVSVTVLFAYLATDGAGESSVITLIDNPGPSPVLAGLSVSRRLGPAWGGAGPRERFAERTARRRYRAGKQAIIGIVPADGMRVLPVHFPPAHRRYRVVAVIGQADRRLRVISIPLDVGRVRYTRPRPGTIADLFLWLN